MLGGVYVCVFVRTLMFRLLPPELQRHCYGFDKTYHDIYKNVLKEMQRPELTALLRSVRTVKRVMFSEVQYTDFFMTNEGLFLVCDEDERYIRADLLDINDGCQWLGFEWFSIDRVEEVAARYGWPALLGCVNGFEKECVVGQTTYYVYRCKVDGAMINNIRRAKHRVDITL